MPWVVTHPLLVLVPVLVLLPMLVLVLGRVLVLVLPLTPVFRRQRDGMRLVLVLLLAVLLVLPRHHVTASEPRDLRSAGSGEMLSGEIDNYLSELKDFYTKVGRPR